MTKKDYQEDAAEFLEKYAAECGITPSHFIKDRPDGAYLVIEFSEPADRHYEILNKVNENLDSSNIFQDRSSINKRARRPANPLTIPETELLVKELSSSLTVDKDTFGDDFFSRYTESWTGTERAIVLPVNTAVYGRRGSGKSSLLAYAKHTLAKSAQPLVWIAMQTYAARVDEQVIASVISLIFREAASFVNDQQKFQEIADELEVLSESDDAQAVRTRISRLLPRMRRMISEISNSRGFTIFLDDFHTLGRPLQPELLGTLYSLTRGNKSYIKLSGIEQLTNLWDGNLNRGLEPPHDVQTLFLDHNLTSPDQSKIHIEKILNRHATFCGLPSISYIAADNFIDRLVLSAAAVPRDAISLLAKSIGRSINRGQKAASITSLNRATSEAIEEKLKDIEKDIPQSDRDGVASCLEQIKNFCLNAKKKNAFLVKIANSDKSYTNIQKLVALRFVHLLNEGITPSRAGQRYIALMLDYGFYIGERAATSIELFPETPQALKVKDVRGLPIFSPQ